MSDMMIYVLTMTGIVCLIFGTWVGYTFTILTEQVMDKKGKRGHK